MDLTHPKMPDLAEFDNSPAVYCVPDLDLSSNYGIESEMGNITVAQELTPVTTIESSGLNSSASHPSIIGDQEGRTSPVTPTAVLGTSMQVDTLEPLESRPEIPHSFACELCACQFAEINALLRHVFYMHRDPEFQKKIHPHPSGPPPLPAQLTKIMQVEKKKTYSFSNEKRAKPNPSKQWHCEACSMKFQDEESKSRYAGGMHSGITLVQDSQVRPPPGPAKTVQPTRTNNLLSVEAPNCDFIGWEDDTPLLQAKEVMDYKKTRPIMRRLDGIGLPKNHFTKIEVENPVICPDAQCRKGFADEVCLARHVKRIHPVQVVKHECDVCGEQMANKHNLARHKKIVHPATSKFSCNICEKPIMFSGCKVLALHKLNVHGIELVSKGNGRRRQPTVLRGPNKVIKKVIEFKCARCMYSSPWKGNVDRHHAGVHSHIKKFQCRNCRKRFGTKDNMMVHKCKALTSRD